MFVNEERISWLVHSSCCFLYHRYLPTDCVFVYILPQLRTSGQDTCVLIEPKNSLSVPATLFWILHGGNRNACSSRDDLVAQKLSAFFRRAGENFLKRCGQRWQNGDNIKRSYIYARWEQKIPAGYDGWELQILLMSPKCNASADSPQLLGESGKKKIKS